MKLRQRIAYGYTVANGVKLQNSEVDTYNSLQDSINGFLATNRQVPEHYLHHSHRIIADAMLRQHSSGHYMGVPC